MATAQSATKAKPTSKAKAEPARVEQAITPHLVCAGAAKAIDFYKDAFGAVEIMRLPGPDGKLMHAAVQINGAVVMLVDERADCGALAPTTLKGSPVTIHLVTSMPSWSVQSRPGPRSSFRWPTCSGATAMVSSQTPSGIAGRSLPTSAILRSMKSKMP